MSKITDFAEQDEDASPAVSVSTAPQQAMPSQQNPSKIVSFAEGDDEDLPKPVLPQKDKKATIQESHNKYLDWLETAGRSTKGTILGAEQGITHAVNKMTDSGGKHPFEDIVNSDVNANDAAQQEAKGRLGTAGYLSADIVGQIPTLAALPEAKIAQGAGKLGTFATKAVYNGLGGGLIGASQPVIGEDNQKNNQFIERGKGALGGVAAGTLGELVSPVVKYAGGKIGELANKSTFGILGKIGDKIKSSIPDEAKNAWNHLNEPMTTRRYPQEAEEKATEWLKGKDSPIGDTEQNLGIRKSSAGFKAERDAVKKDAIEYYKNQNYGKDFEPFNFDAEYRQKVASSVDPRLKLNKAQKYQNADGDAHLQSVLENANDTQALKNNVSEQNSILAQALDKIDKGVGAKFIPKSEAKPIINQAIKNPSYIENIVANKNPLEISKAKNAALFYIKENSVTSKGIVDSDVMNQNIDKFKPLFSKQELAQLQKISKTGEYINYGSGASENPQALGVTEKVKNAIANNKQNIQTINSLVQQSPAPKLVRMGSSLLNKYASKGDEAASKNYSDFINATSTKAKPPSYRSLSAIGQPAIKPAADEIKEKIK